MTEDAKKGSGRSQDERVTEELLQVLSTLVDNGQWDASLFLRVSKKRLVALRDEAQALLADLHEESQSSEIKVVQGEHQVTVYIGLHLGGEAPSNARWEAMLGTLGAYAVGRPVYSEEAHAEAALRAKGSSERDGYAAIVINKDGILPVPAEQLRTDRLGHALLTLRVGAIHSENIVKWVCNGHTYRLIRGRLVLHGSD